MRECARKKVRKRDSYPVTLLRLTPRSPNAQIAALVEKVTVNCQPTNRENRKLKKTRRHEKFETIRNITARGTSSTLATLLVEQR